MARKAKTPEATGPKRVYGVLVEKIDEDSVDAAIASLELPADGTLEDKVARLVAHFRENTQASSLAKCDVCEGKSDAALDACPYCGTGDESETTEAPAEEAKAPPAQQTIPTEAPKAEAPAPKAEKEKAPKATPKEAKAPKAKAVKAIKAELSTVDVDPRFSIKDLDAAVERANVLTRAGAVVAFELGQQLKGIHTDQLWKLRKGEDGAPKYKSFESFVMAELEISRQTAYEQIDVSSNYEKADVEKIGYKKLALLLKAPESARPTLKAKADGGATFRDLAAEVKNARVEAGVTKRSTGRKEMPAGKAPKGTGKGDSITVAALLGKQTVTLYKSIKKTDSKELVPATSLDDEPWGMVELRNGVVEVFQVASTAKGLVLQVKRERRKPAK